MRRFTTALLSFAIVSAIAGCTTPVGDFSENTARHKSEMEEWTKRMEAPRDDRVRITSMPTAGERITLEKHRWLKDIRVTLSLPKAGGAVNAASLSQMLKAKGVNIMSSLPLDSYGYNGFGVTNVDGETALRLLFGPMGLDYDINDEGQYVVVTPMRSRTFYIKLGERKTKYKSGTMTGNIGSTGSGGTSSTGGGGTGQGSTSGAGYGNTNGSSGVSTGLDTGTGELSVDSDFWKNSVCCFTSSHPGCDFLQPPATASGNGRHAGDGAEHADASSPAGSRAGCIGWRCRALQHPAVG